ncbi:hypothetical protein KIN20_020205 [Parelaphostrongylus tenuis]|uniref:Uncharacterized protein n=1 Tax=Parelaphostrongylus tenuis TaxID=148309 RepID=A0AAD5QQN6_PARTN|nr:hypothetical protein KIN20_020205 [Parelaphostrongylus tenuis]
MDMMKKLEAYFSDTGRNIAQRPGTQKPSPKLATSRTSSASSTLIRNRGKSPKKAGAVKETSTEKQKSLANSSEILLKTKEWKLYLS